MRRSRSAVAGGRVMLVVRVMLVAWAVPVVAAAVALATAGCSAAPPVGGDDVAAMGHPPVSLGTASRVRAANPRPYGAADTAFGLDLLGAWCRSQPGSNIVFSPESLATGLGMAYLGARGGTATAMARVLHLPVASGLPLEAGMRARWAALGKIDGPGVTLDGSNRVWADPSFSTLRSYLDAVATAYSAGLWRAPLQSDPEKARQMINAVIAHDTRGHIPELLPAGSLGGAGWVLTDALYLDADWATPFAHGLTEPGQFATASGGTTTAQFMHGDGYRSATADGWTAVALPYKGGRLAMTALLPPAGPAASGCQVPPTAAVSKISTTLYGPGGGNGGLVSVALPKVNLSSHQDMTSLLTRLGMGIAFAGAANFTGLSPAACCISTVEHAATLQVNEKGTVASAATGVVIMPSMAMLQVAFDRPYLMLVTDKATGEPLFLARVADPAAP